MDLLWWNLLACLAILGMAAGVEELWCYYERRDKVD